MRKDSRLSRVLHALIHLHHYGKPATSDDLGKMLGTNPVVVRRTMAALREQGYVSALKGHNGGWSLAKPLTEITLYDVHKALGEGSVFTIGLTDEHNNCLIEHGVNQALRDVMQEAEALMLARFKQVTLANLASEFDKHKLAV
ncbi:Rrf2 family transcriptional regulator [Bowmanella denitrificans]|uniref:Rrf2 family transcriptional regulator n=1 Tax=Bowmanella denitrificans TaxID=366582 RepID=A0ABP3GYL3_9ALTE